MMNDVIISIGDIIQNKMSNIRYRVISILASDLVLCEMEIQKFNLLLFNKTILFELLSENTVEILNDDMIVFDEQKLSLSVKTKYNKYLKIMHEIEHIYGPEFLSLIGKKPKPELEEILNKYSCARTTFWRICTRYFQSGMRNYSLIDSKGFGLHKGMSYEYKSRPGKKSVLWSGSQVILNNETILYFDEAIKEYKSGRQKTLNSSFERMNNLHYTSNAIIDGKISLVLRPQAERPTLKQFYRYASKRLTKQEKDIIKTSAQEQRNNKRILISDSLFDVYGPGDMVEIDACEADVSLVSMFDINQTVGRPIVYFMIDVYSRIILAVSVAFDNNSVTGISNLFLNLADDKKEYCQRYGMGFDNYEIWPSNIIPRRIRVDRGSEFKSKEFDRICNEFGIEKQIVPGATGSYKGIVEQSFHQMHSRQNVHLEDYGLIEKRYDSQHHKEATLNISQYTEIVINFVLTHNQQYNKNYPLTKDMLEKNVQPIPADLWQYGIKKYGAPRSIISKEQYLFTLMTPVKAKVSRKGIGYKGLWYLPENDKMLMRDMFNAGTKHIPFEVRIDLRCVGAVYYIRNNKLIVASLNKSLVANRDYENLTMKEWDDIRTEKAKMDVKGRQHNEQLLAYNYAVNSNVVEQAKKTVYSNTKNIRESRETEKQAVAQFGNIGDRLTDNIQEKVESAIIKPNEQESITDKNKTDDLQMYSSFEEALEDFYENN